MSAETVALRAMTDADLKKELDEAHQALFNLRFQAATRQLANTSQIEKTRRRIARVRTLIRERAILAELDSAINAAAGNGE
jgi:large subunit ribosomal protein L29